MNPENFQARAENVVPILMRVLNARLKVVEEKAFLELAEDHYTQAQNKYIASLHKLNIAETELQTALETM